jgi:hypothetical protein
MSLGSGPPDTRPPGHPPPPPPPPPPTKSVLADIDAALIACLALAYFGPADEKSAASVRQACAAEQLLARLRAARRAVRELADAFAIETPARRDNGHDARTSQVATPGGPGQNAGRGGEGAQWSTPPRPAMPKPPALTFGEGPIYDALPSMQIGTGDCGRRP